MGSVVVITHRDTGFRRLVFEILSSLHIQYTDVQTRSILKTHACEPSISRSDAPSAIRVRSRPHPARCQPSAEDYAAIVLLDERYSKASVQGKLPSWIKSEVHVDDNV